MPNILFNDHIQNDDLDEYPADNNKSGKKFAIINFGKNYFRVFSAENLENHRY